jgi:pimeloyl-ACP methyl ester carboxylesterase
MTTLPLACERGASRLVRISGLRLHLIEWPAPGRPGVCFLHGGSAHAHWFDAVVPRLLGRFHVVSIDQRGHGLSEWPQPPTYATEDFADDLLGVLDSLGWRSAVVIGHSMGGHTAMAFAAWHPERVSALVIADSRPALPPDRLARLRARGQRPLRRYPSRQAIVDAFRLLPPETTADPALLAHLATAGVVERPGGWTYRFDPACNHLRRPADAWPLLPRIVAPTLIVRGEHSPIMTSEVGERVASLVPRSTLVEIPGAHHHVVLDAPDAVATALDDFLKLTLQTA